MTVDEFLSKLEMVRRSGGSWTARCPAHEDSNPSLSITEGEDKILVNCFAGCDTNSICEALGLTFSDLNLKARDFGKPVATWWYTDELGNNLFEVLKYEKPNEEKKFLQRHLVNGEWVWKLEGVRRVPYKLPELIEGVLDGKTIYITEGEKDADTLREHGFVATTFPHGAGKWKDEYAIYFRGAKVIICADRDTVGRAHADKVHDGLVGVAENIWIFRPKQGKDVTDHFEAGFGIEDLVPQQRQVRRGLITASELVQHLRDQFTLSPEDVPGYAPWGDAGDLREIVLRAGRAYAVGAYTGDGKTSFALQGAASLARQGVSVGYFSLEMTDLDLGRKLYQHYGVPLWKLEQHWKMSEEDWKIVHQAEQEIESWQLDVIFKSDISAEEIEQQTIEREYKAIFVDHLHRGVWGSDRHKLGEAMNRLTNLALEQNIIVVILCQLRKYARGKEFEHYPMPTLQDFRETSIIGDDAAMALAIWRERDDNGVSFSKDNTQVIILKNRYTTGFGDSAGRLFMPEFDLGRSVFTSPVNWVGGNE